MSESSGSLASTTVLTLEPFDSHCLSVLCGPLDQNLTHIAGRVGIDINRKSNTLFLRGEQSAVQRGSALLSHLYVLSRDLDVLEDSTVHTYLQDSQLDLLIEEEQSKSDQSEQHERVAIATTRKKIFARGHNQMEFVRRIREGSITFGIGPAGTGKTYLAVACAVEALANKEVSRILLVRPAVEVGEKLGFLPGDLNQKVDPYLRPLYDALQEMLGGDRFKTLTERGIIEAAPLAYMRGRTLNESFVILDESQNTTVAQMKMFLTRIGFGSKVTITGDLTQIDLPTQTHGQSSGLVHVLNILPKIKGLSVSRFTSKDVVRHPIVQQIVDAYDRDDERRKQRQQERSADARPVD